MTDRIVSAIDPAGRVRILVAVTTETVGRAQEIHDLFPTPCAALGRLLTGAALMAHTLKNPTDALTLQIRGDGPIGGMVVVSGADSAVRGYAVQPFADLPLNAKGKFDVAGALGKGTLSVIKDLGMREPYVGSVALVSGEIAEDLTWYHATSEQTPTVMTLGVLIAPDGKVLQAGGLFLQLMPEAEEDLIAELEMLVTSLPPMTAMLEAGETPESILTERFAVLSPQILDTRPVRYVCNCSEERMERNLVSLGRNELVELAGDPDGIELQCHFCNHRYHFTNDAVARLLERATKP